MAILPNKDLTLEAMMNIVAKDNAEQVHHAHGVLSMGALEECSRAIWLKFRRCFIDTHDVEDLALVDVGESKELLTVARLRKVAGVEIIERDPDDGKQITFLDIEAHFRGKPSGFILGIAEAPKTWHLFEALAVGEDHLFRFRESKFKHGSKFTLENWDRKAFIRAQLYMHYSGLQRHYCVVGRVDGGDYDSCRTEYDPTVAIRELERASGIITDNIPPKRLSEDPAFPACRSCTVAPVCHNSTRSTRDCRNCIHAKPVEAGKWNCDRWGKILESFVHCPAHKYIPELVNGRILEADIHSITYKMKDGSIYKDGEK